MDIEPQSAPYANLEAWLHAGGGTRNLRREKSLDHRGALIELPLASSAVDGTPLFIRTEEALYRIATP